MCAIDKARRLRSTQVWRCAFASASGIERDGTCAEYASSHGTSHTRHPKPTKKKDFFQPKAMTSEATKGAPSAKPARVPQLTSPEANPRSLESKNVLTTFMPPGR